MDRAVIQYLIDCLAVAVLDFCKAKSAPVDVRDVILSPPPDLIPDLALVESTSINFTTAVWVRGLNRQGMVFVNGNLPSSERRYLTACALFDGLCHSEGGRAAGLGGLLNDRDWADRFARRLLMPFQLLPPDWETRPARELADLFDVPIKVVEKHLRELRAEKRQP